MHAIVDISLAFQNPPHCMTPRVSRFWHVNYELPCSATGPWAFAFDCISPRRTISLCANIAHFDVWPFRCLASYLALVINTASRYLIHSLKTDMPSFSHSTTDSGLGFGCQRHCATIYCTTNGECRPSDDPHSRDFQRSRIPVRCKRV